MSKRQEFCRRKGVVGLFLVVAVSLMLTSGCAVLQGKGSKEYRPTLMLTVHLNSLGRFQPGEAVVCTTRLINITSNEVEVSFPNARSITFWCSDETLENIHQVEPVVSEQEDMNRIATLEPYQYIERLFVFTTVAKTTGSFTLQGKYEGVIKLHGKKEPAPVQAISIRVKGSVAGSRVFERDRTGLIYEEEAIRLVREKVNATVSSVVGQLVYDKAGFLAWWITCTRIKPNGKEVREAYLVNPYIGAVREKVAPYVEKQKKKPPVKPFRPYQQFKPENDK